MSLRTDESLPLNIEALRIRVGEFGRALMRHSEGRLALERARRPLPQCGAFPSVRLILRWLNITLHSPPMLGLAQTRASVQWFQNDSWV